jgi:hypothetical protein
MIEANSIIVSLLTAAAVVSSFVVFERRALAAVKLGKMLIAEIVGGQQTYKKTL